MKGVPEYVYWTGKVQIPLEDHVFAFLGRWILARDNARFSKLTQARYDDTRIVIV